MCQFHTNVFIEYQLTCEECKRRGIACSGVWKFHSQHGKFLLQCKTCRLKKRGCPFRRFEEEEEDRAITWRQKAGQRKRQLQESPIDITDSSDSDSERKVAGPSSRPEKKVKLEVKDGRDWGALEETLLKARTRKVEIQTKAEIETAKVNLIIEETERKVRG